MAEQRENYKGREIILRSGAEALAARGDARVSGQQGAIADEPELTIDGKQIFIVRNSAGAYIASGFAFDPQQSPVDLAKKIIDYEEAER
jgi:acetyl esterase/lipase